MKILFVFNYVVSKQPSVEMFNSSKQKTFARLQNHVEYFRNSKKKMGAFTKISRNHRLSKKMFIVQILSILESLVCSGFLVAGQKISFNRGDC